MNIVFDDMLCKPRNIRDRAELKVQTQVRDTYLFFLYYSMVPNNRPERINRPGKNAFYILRVLILKRYWCLYCMVEVAFLPLFSSMTQRKRRAEKSEEA